MGYQNVGIWLRILNPVWLLSKSWRDSRRGNWQNSKLPKLSSIVQVIDWMIGTLKVIPIKIGSTCTTIGLEYKSLNFLKIWFWLKVRMVIRLKCETQCQVYNFRMVSIKIIYHCSTSMGQLWISHIWKLSRVFLTFRRS